VSSVDAGTLFPHNDGYAVYAGRCTANDPDFWMDGWFQPGPPPGPGFIKLDPGTLAPANPVNVLMPVAVIHVVRADGSAFRRPLIMASQLDSGCTSNVFTQTLGPTTTTSRDWYFTLALPFGKYRICAYDGSRRARTAATPTSDSVGDLTPDAVGAAPVRGNPLSTPATAGSAGTLSVPTSGGSSTCP
jgi:hypothetical protein